jgi:predicted Rossmann fold nucleotide-binding protein DprA/Smf involved in DNA uptake
MGEKVGELDYLLALHLLFFESPKRVRDVLSLCPDFESWKASCASYVAQSGFSKSAQTRVLNFNIEQALYLCKRDMAKQNVSWISCVDPRFPDALRHISDPPIGFFYQGDLSVLSAPLLGVVGPRMPSEYGRNVVSSLVPALARVFGIVSGMALGIDTLAHQAALSVGAPTVAVMGTSFDTIYPTSNRSLFEQIIS